MVVELPISKKCVCHNGFIFFNKNSLKSVNWLHLKKHAKVAERIRHLLQNKGETTTKYVTTLKSCLLKVPGSWNSSFRNLFLLPQKIAGRPSTPPPPKKKNGKTFAPWLDPVGLFVVTSDVESPDHLRHSKPFAALTFELSWLVHGLSWRIK